MVVALHDGALQLGVHPGPPEDTGVVQETDHPARLRVHRKLLNDDVLFQGAVAEAHPLADVGQAPRARAGEERRGWNYLAARMASRRRSTGVQAISRYLVYGKTR